MLFPSDWVLRAVGVLVLCATVSLVDGAERQNGTSEPGRNGSSVSRIIHTNFEQLFQDCLPRDLQSSQINCKAKVARNFTSDFYGQCVRDGVIRLVGEYDVVGISCSAPFHLDFEFDGFQPTEAIKVTSWKELEGNETSLLVSQYHLELKIYSNKALFLRHNPESNGSENGTCTNCRRFDYPRTGHHIIHDMFNASVRFPVYFFFEESSLEPGLIYNNYTRISVVPNSSGRMNLTVPCRPSHFNGTVQLYRRFSNGVSMIWSPCKAIEVAEHIVEPLTNLLVKGTVEICCEFQKASPVVHYSIRANTLARIQDAEYSPWRGFNLYVDLLEAWNGSGEFECVLEYGDYRNNLVFSYPPDSTRAFGFDRIFLQPPRNNKVTLNHEANPITRDPITVNITCVIQTDDKHPYMGSIGCENPTHIRLVREFILPEYGNKSYTRRNTTTLVGDNFPQELKIYRAYQTGITYCVSQRYSRIYEYAAGLNRVMYNLDFGTDYTTLPHTSPPKEVHIHLELVNPTDQTLSERPDSVKLIIDRPYNFSCRIDMFTIARTIVWHVKFKNGTRQRVKVDYNFPSEYSYYEIVASWTIAKVGCSAVFWNNDKWRTDELETIVDYESSEMNPEVEQTVVVAAVSFVILLVILITAGFFYRKLNRRRWQFSNLEVAEFEKGNPSVLAETGISEGGHLLPYDKSYEVEEKSFFIDWDRLLGSGEFGMVYEGLLFNSRKAAVKMVKPDMDKTFTKALLSELKIMIYLGHHENILELLGAHTSKLRQGTVYLFLEFCMLGSLESYLRKNRHHLQPQEPSPYTQFSMISSDEFELSASAESMMSMKDLYTWAHEIALGMEFLSSKQVIHGDLATRNVLLTETKTAKICDFGLSRRLHNYKVYRKNHDDSTPLPWPWMAPEALQTLTFSTKTDVWSFGITVWEIFSLGEVPYPGMHCGIDFISKLREGMRNLRPKLAPLDLYKEVMRECWRFHPEDRPSFNELCFLIDNMICAFSAGDSRNMSVSSDSGIASTVGTGYIQHGLALGM